MGGFFLWPITAVSVATLPTIKRTWASSILVWFCQWDVASRIAGYTSLGCYEARSSVHACLAVSVLAGMELGKSNIKSFAPSFVSKSQQGKGFGYVATVLRLGEILAGFVAVDLYENNGSALSSMGAASAMLFLSALMLTWLLPPGIRSRGADTSALGLKETPRSDDNAQNSLHGDISSENATS